MAMTDSPNFSTLALESAVRKVIFALSQETSRCSVDQVIEMATLASSNSHRE